MGGILQMTLRVLLISFSVVFVSCSTCSASSLNWINGKLNTNYKSVDYPLSPRCVAASIKVFSYTKSLITNDYSTTRDMCIQESSKFSLATDGARMYLKMKNGTVYTPTNLSKYATVIPDSDDILDRQYQGNYEPTKLVKYENVTQTMRIDYYGDTNAVAYYYIPPEFISYLIQQNTDGNLTYQNAFSFAVSENGNYAVAYTDYLNIVELNLKTGDERVVAKWATEWYMGYTIPRAAAISNDGKYIYIAGREIIYSTSNCGDVLNSLRSMVKACPGRDMGEVLSPTPGSPAYYSTQVNFSDDGWTLHILANPQPGLTGFSKIIDISPKSLIPSSLDYLALGDSYASGEGDITKTKNGQGHYIRNTSNENGCHLSDESYPFLLGKLKSITPVLAQSVACSGARVDADYSQPLLYYMGQGSKLKSLGATQIETRRQTAISTFQPGEIPQIEFVKANQPKVITLMGGGNDVGFKDILLACASSFDTCQYAVPGSNLRKALGASIQGRYKSTVALIQAIQSVSPSTTIYVIGYPSFVSNSEVCLNGALLNVSERSMINISVAYMNAVLQAAAKNVGANYIDLETSLNGGRICEGSKYMTGVVAKLLGAMNQELFHPNATGHLQFAHSIVSAGFSTESDNNPDGDATTRQPAVPTYYDSEPQSTAKQAALSEQSVIKPRQIITIAASEGSFKPESSLWLTLNSDPILLGEITSDAHGGFSGQVTIPSTVKPGYHTLLAEGIDGSGIITRQYQFVEVDASDQDADGDGVINQADQCLFIPSWRDEQTGQDICAAPTLISGGASTASKSVASSSNTTAYVADVNNGFTADSQGTGTSVLGAKTAMLGNSAKLSSAKKGIDSRMWAGIGAALMLVGIMGLRRLARKESS